MIMMMTVVVLTVTLATVVFTMDRIMSVPMVTRAQRCHDDEFATSPNPKS